MLFSIIVPAYNAEKCIEKCIKSVIQQSCQDWELIIVNDGSIDGTRSIIDRYVKEDKRILGIHKQNSGQLFARRSGIEIARGNYLLFLDSDDYWDSKCLSVLSATIHEYSPDVIMFPALRIGKTRSPKEYLGKISDQPKWIDKEHIYHVLISGPDYNALWLKAWHRSLFLGDTTDYSKFSGVCWGEDKVQMLYPITKARNILYIPECLYCYVDNPNSVVHTIDTKRIPIMLGNEGFGYLYSYMKKWSMDTPANREVIAVHYLRNYISVYYKIRRSCVSRQDKKMLREFNWDRYFSKDSFQYIFSKRLSFREKIKLVLAIVVKI